MDSLNLEYERELLVSFMQNDLSDPVRYEALQLAQRKLVSALEQLEQAREALLRIRDETDFSYVMGAHILEAGLFDLVCTTLNQQGEG